MVCFQGTPGKLSLYIYLFIYIYIYIYTYLHTSIHTYLHTSIHTYIHTYIHIYVYIYIYTYTSCSVLFQIHFFPLPCLIHGVYIDVHAQLAAETLLHQSMGQNCPIYPTSVKRAMIYININPLNFQKILESLYSNMYPKY